MSIGPQPSGDVRPRRARMLPEPHQPHREFGGKFVGVAAVVNPLSPGCSLWEDGGLDVLVEEDLVAVRVLEEEAVRAGGGLVGLADEGDALALDLTLDAADVGESVELLGVGVPARIEREDVLVEHALEEADG